MRYVTLGRSGLRVSELALGAMTFGSDAVPLETARSIFNRYVEAGGNFIDTADKYGGGTSERCVGELLGSERDRFVLATKYTLERRAGDVNAAGNQRKNLVTALDASLRRLGTDYIDVYWVHSRDILTPVDEVMRALDDQVRAGKILYVGASDWPAWETAQANTLAELRGWTPFSAIQVPYSLLERTTERELQPMAQGLGLAVCAWSPLARGVLSGRSTNGADSRTQAIASELAAVAGEVGAPPSQVALAWLRGRPGTVIPLLGASSEAQLAENLGCLDLELSEEHVRRLDEVSDTGLGFPYEFMQRDAVRALVYGSRAELISRG